MHLYVLQDGGLHSVSGGLLLLPLVCSSFNQRQVHLVPRFLLPLPNPHHCKCACSFRIPVYLMFKKSKLVYDASDNSAGLHMKYKTDVRWETGDKSSD